MTSILPEEDQGEIPVGFSIVGHVGTSVDFSDIEILTDRYSTLESSR